jgi:molybdopterin/thiamine biosynthesis adenylyltransferase
VVAARGVKFIGAIKTPQAWSKLLHGKFGMDLPILRFQGRRVDTDYVLGTNGADGTPALAGRSVVLVGCGAIGGFLAFALAQLGAGAGGGRLLLIDDDKLSARNTARHRLGADKIDTNKAEACKAAIDAALPGLASAALPMKVEQARAQVLAGDLVIDATGEQAVGDLLNAWRLEIAEGQHAPDMLHVWIEGGGAAVQSYFSSDPAFGCFRCLQPDLSQPARYTALKPGGSAPVATACGEAPFSPYSPAAPMAAASLAAAHARNWALGAPRPLLRTLRLDYDDTVERKPVNPTRNERCPACAQQ